jgi:putative holliday junction resolvase
VTRIIGLDPGSRRIGVAISDSAQRVALPRPYVAVGDTVFDDVAAVVTEVGAETVVVGRPTSLAGRTTDATAAADRFREELARRLAGVAVVGFDERLTTASATAQLRDAGKSARDQRDLIDSAAATVMLQHYLDALAP